MTPTNQPKMICHAPGDQCHGCDHSHGKADVCRYAPQPMIDTKTPIKAAEEMARLQMIRGSDVLDAAAIIRSHIAAELTAANERNAALERASLTTQEKDQCAKAIQTAMNPSGSLFIPKGWNVILAKLEGNLEGAEKCIGMHTANLEYEITQLRERNAKLLALATKMLDGLAHDEGCFLHGSTVYDEAECSCEAKLFATALAELKGEK